MLETHKTSRRDALKKIGTGVLSVALTSGSVIAGRGESVNLSPDQPAKVWDFIEKFAQMSEEEQREVWEKLDDRDRETMKTALTPGKIVSITEATNKVSAAGAEAASIDTKEITHTVKAKGGFNHVVLWHFNHKVAWDYTGDSVMNVNQNATADVKLDLISFWQYDGVGQKSTQSQAEWTDAFMSGKFTFRLTKWGNLNRGTSFSEVRVKEDGNWSVQRDESHT